MNGIAIRKGDWLGLADGEPVAGGGDFDDVAYAVVERLLERAARAADAARRARTRRRSTACSSGSPRRIRTSRSTSRRAASRTTTCFCRPSRVRTGHGAADPDPPRRGQPGLPRGARAAARHARRHRGRRVGRRRQRGRSPRSSSYQPAGRADGLPAARAWTACRRPRPCARRIPRSRSSASPRPRTRARSRRSTRPARPPA